MSVVKDALKLLSFKLDREGMLTFGNKHLIFGIIGTWVAGMGRYWDEPKASLLQHLGLGSVIYIFLLAAFIWLIILPFKIPNWKYKTVLTFISLTSFPAILYAIPVERFNSIEVANQINVWFLAIVALWRLMLLYYFLKVYSRMSVGNIITVTLMPICLIITSLTILNLHRVVFNIMGGLHENDQTAHDGAYTVLLVLTVVSAILCIPLLIAYGLGIYFARNKKVQNKIINKE